MSEIEKKGFKITAMQMLHMNTANTEEFYEIYKGVLMEYTVSHCIKNCHWLSVHANFLRIKKGVYTFVQLTFDYLI